MIKTEATRFVLSNDYQLPFDVQKVLEDWNKTHSIKLEILFDPDSNKWQIYRIKSYGVTSKEDLLHWQMSAPTEGLSSITPGIFTWLQQYDTSNGGLYSREEIQNKWLKQFYEGLRKEDERKEKIQQDTYYQWNTILQQFLRCRAVIARTPVVGWNKKKGKPLRAMPKGVARKLAANRRRLGIG